MHSTPELYEKVAKNCSSYMQNESAAQNSMSDSRSCTTCEHFDKDHYCNLDLYDRIVSENNFK